MAMSAGSTTREYSVSTVKPAVPVRREETCLQFFWLLASSYSKAAFIVMEVGAIWYCIERAWALQADAGFV